MITQKQKENLLLAAQRAIHPGACTYTLNNNPCCVIGQLAHIEGVSLEIIDTWGNRTVINLDDRPTFLGYPMDLLNRLQCIWDLGSSEATRDTMVTTIEDYPLTPSAD